MNRLSTLLAACVVLTLAGCNAILGIEKAKVVPRDQNDGSVAPCVDGDDVCVPTPTACTTLDECKTGEACVDGVCVAPDDDGGAPDAGDAGDASSDAPMGDGGDAGDAGCPENELRCEGAALPARLQCVGGVWKSGPPCESGKLCDTKASVSGECKPALELCLGREPGKPFCDGVERKTCGPDLISIESVTCKSREHCSMASGAACAECVSGEAKCEGDQLFLCNAAGTAFEAKEMCNPGECKANLMRCSALFCDPEAYTCSPANQLLHCNDSGTAYLSMEDCGKGVCDAANKECDTCKPDDVLGCAQDKVNQLVCGKDGRTTVMRTCASIDPAKPACTGTGQCVGCEPLSQTCQNNTTLISCSGQGVSTPSTCTRTTCVGDKCTGECAPGDQICAGSASPARKVCGPDGKYIAGTDCEANTLCDNSTTGGQCRAIAQGCASRLPGDAVCNGLTRAVCGPDRVSLSSTMDCISAAHCQLGSAANCGQCLDNEHKCVGAELQVCNAAHTAFISKKLCASEALCSPGAGDCTTQKCTPNEWYCNTGNILQQCNETGSDFKAGTPCGSGTCDRPNHQCDMCSPGAVVSCTPGGQVNRCSSDGQRLEPENCPSGTPVCTTGGICRQCQPNVNVCASSTSINLCDGSGNRTTQACPAHTTCYMGACRGVCAPGEFNCPTAASTARQACGEDGTFISTTACSNTQRCNTVTDTCNTIVEGCSGMNPGDVVCIGTSRNVRAVCGPDLVTYSGTNTACTSDKHCQQGIGACASCLTNQYNCNGAQLQVCNAGHNGWTDVGQPCLTAALCNTTLGMCTAATCQPGAWSCNGDQLRHCNPDGTGYVQSDTKQCGTSLCNASAGRCNVCVPNTVRCVDEGGKSRVKCAADGSGESTAGTSACPNACLNATCVDCAPTATRCDPTNATTLLRYRQLCSSSGAWGTGTDCFATNRTCLFDSADSQFKCGGACAAGQQFLCMGAFPGDTWSCQSNGQYGFTRSCVPSVPERCETRNTQAKFGQCVPNAPFVMCANGSESLSADCLGSTTRPYTLGAIVAQPFIPTEAVKLTQFGARTGSGTSNCSAYFSLHSNASGQPGAIMNSTNIRSLNSDSLNLTAANLASDASTKLAAGTTYWLVARFGGSGTCTIQYSTANVAAGPYRRGDDTDFFAPDNMTPGMTSPVASGGEIKLFIQAQRQ